MADKLVSYNEIESSKNDNEILHYLGAFFFLMSDIDMQKEPTYDFRSAFDDRKLPVNNRTAERMLKIDKVAMTLLEEMLDKLYLEQPHLFKTLKGH